MLNIFQNDCSSTGEAAPLEKPELKLFLEEPEPCQTDPQCQHASGLKYTSKIKAYWPIILGEVWSPGVLRLHALYRTAELNGFKIS